MIGHSVQRPGNRGIASNRCSGTRRLYPSIALLFLFSARRLRSSDSSARLRLESLPSTNDAAINNGPCKVLRLHIGNATCARVADRAWLTIALTSHGVVFSVA